MTSLSENRRLLRLAVVLWVAAALIVPAEASGFANGPDGPAPGTEWHSSAAGPISQPFAIAETVPVGTIRASALRLALIEANRIERGGDGNAAHSTDRCTASLAEKLAWLYALVGGSILLAYGPREREGGVWTMDGKSETVAGATAIGLSFGLLHDIRKRGW